MTQGDKRRKRAILLHGKGVRASCGAEQDKARLWTLAHGSRRLVELVPHIEDVGSRRGDKPRIFGQAIDKAQAPRRREGKQAQPQPGNPDVQVSGTQKIPAKNDRDRCLSVRRIIFCVSTLCQNVFSSNHT